MTRAARMPVVVVLAVVLAAMLSACSGSAPLSEPGTTPEPPPPPARVDGQRVIAHRGASGHAPEHTIAAYDLALTMGADYLEQDIAMTGDGVLVCLHDATLDRTARGPAENCSGRVGTKTLAQLKTCDMGSWFNEAYPDRARPEYVGLQIPKLEEVFQRYGSDIRYYIETKTIGTLRPMEAELLRLINEYGLRDGAVSERQVLVQSFTPDSLLRMRLLDPEIPLIQLMFAGSGITLPVAAAYSFGIGPPVGETTQALVDQAHALGLAVHPYTVNSTEDLERIGTLCVDGIFTNFPDRYRALVDAGAFAACPEPIR
ncbi:MAG TPA: glycerophosphodiester phosphodiesterase [Solimonas sp.]